MKNIIRIFAVFLLACMLSPVQAQQQKEVNGPGKPIQIKQEPVASPLPVLQPQDGPAPGPAAKPSSVTSQADEATKPTNEEAKKALIIKSIDDDPTRKLTAEQLRSSNGKTDKPKPVIFTAEQVPQ